jgi:glyoxylate/hydroxypyruvate reductase
MLGCTANRRSTIAAVTIVIASYLEPVHVRRIEAVAPGVRVRYDPDLLAPPRFAADHTGRPDFRRTPEQEARFRAWLAEADVLYDFDRRLAPAAAELAPAALDPGDLVGHRALREAGLDRTGIRITNAAGIHAVPLAEHTLLSLLYFVKDVPARRATSAPASGSATAGASCAA